MTTVPRDGTAISLSIAACAAALQQTKMGAVVHVADFRSNNTA
jgi:hypothetical protein